jgi:hypothetical protein
MDYDDWQGIAFIVFIVCMTIVGMAIIIFR